MEPDGGKRFSRATIVRNARRVGVIAVAAAFATPLALPAFASGADQGSEESLSALVARDAQTVSGVVTAGESGLTEARLEIQATTPEELQAIRSELQAAAEAEAERQQEEAAAAAASRGTAGTGGGADAASSAAPAGASGSVIADAALAQVGVSQDCVALVRRAIAAAGLTYTGMNNLSSLGPQIPRSQASPGDIIYYANGGTGRAHIGIYIGGDRAVHGGWSGYNTVVAGVDIGGSTPIFYDVT
ncbi:Cell wall-associated hydrolase, NlpC family [Agrococcus carbonis]|uniref:Cell wall-associated hydrolase, NlpC family n=2 Tax=Agrococcus carbonis TaxID=684552 RepID=A0A1H1RDJ7_9MICO|nr:Cell wall-associated hydrolase, NlpC family [Agrococcus carbonis]